MPSGHIFFRVKFLKAMFFANQIVFRVKLSIYKKKKYFSVKNIYSTEYQSNTFRVKKFTKSSPVFWQPFTKRN